MQPGCVSRRHSASSAVIGFPTIALLGAASVLGVGPVASAAPAARGHAGSRTSVVWLCRPGAKHDPCAFTRAATSVPASGPRTPAGLTTVHAPATQRFDCFFAYPTVSTERGSNANLAVQANETGVAIDEVSQFSQVCTVWAPMYRQATAEAVAGLGSRHASATLLKAEKVAYASLLSAWKSFLAHDNHDRPVILIGHSQGSVLLIKLIANQIDAARPLRKKLVVAILAGGNVQVPIGKMCESPLVVGFEVT
jgi:hypothetical protein